MALQDGDGYTDGDGVSSATQWTEEEMPAKFPRAKRRCQGQRSGRGSVECRGWKCVDAGVGAGAGAGVGGKCNYSTMQFSQRARRAGNSLHATRTRATRKLKSITSTTLEENKSGELQHSNTRHSSPPPTLTEKFAMTLANSPLIKVVSEWRKLL